MQYKYFLNKKKTNGPECIGFHFFFIFLMANLTYTSSFCLNFLINSPFLFGWFGFIRIENFLQLLVFFFSFVDLLL